MNNLKLKFIGIIGIALLSSCSVCKMKKANKEFSNFQYSSAIKDYTKVLKKKDDHEARIKLANCYRLINDVEKAEPVFAEIVKYPESEPINMFYYAKILMSEGGKYSEAESWFKKYLEQVPNDLVSQMLLVSCKAMNASQQDSSLYTLKEINFPDYESMFAQVPYKNGIVFTADKKAERNSQKDGWTGKSYYDLYFSEKDKTGNWLSPALLAGEINGKYHDGPAVFNKTGDVVYFTRSNYYKYNLHKSTIGENNLKLFSAKVVNGKWEQLTELPFNSDEYSVGQACLSDDEKTLYFISDMPGGEGKTDIYSSAFDGTTWGKPMNLGKEINTPGSEMFPTLSSDETFYFSSDAHEDNRGGLDVFATTYDAGSKMWLPVKSLDYPLNSNKDDFSFMMNKDNKTGYISSNRNGADRIFEVQKYDPSFTVSGTVTIKGKGIPFENATIIMITETGDSKPAKRTVQTDKDGKYTMNLDPESEYIVYGTKENYFTQSVDISTKGKKHSQNFVADFTLDQIVIEKPIVLENIYYDLNKWGIRPDAGKELDKLVKLLQENPNIFIELGSHTDARAGDKYNLVLSEKRAKAAVEYLAANGIDDKRLKYKGYGETQLINRCKNNVGCTEEEHQQNRRTEFKVIKIEKQISFNSEK